MSSQPDDVLDEAIDVILKDCVEMCADCVICGAGPSGYYRNQVKALIAEQVRLALLDELIALEKLYCNDENVLIDYMRLQIAELQKPTKENL